MSQCIISKLRPCHVLSLHTLLSSYTFSRLELFLEMERFSRISTFYWSIHINWFSCHTVVITSKNVH